MRRATIAGPVQTAGVARDGSTTELTVLPASAGMGILFNCCLRAGPRCAVADRHATWLVGRGVRIGPVEHLMAAIAALRLTDLDVRVNGAELPLCDGSSRPFFALLRRAGVVRFRQSVAPARLHRPVLVHRAGGLLVAFPGGPQSLGLLASFADLGTREVSISIGSGRIGERVLPARTFGRIAGDVAALRRRLRLRFRLIRAGQTIVPQRWRYPDEPWRHKLLDLFGDLALLGRPLLARVFAFQPGHRLNIEFLRALHRELEAT